MKKERIVGRRIAAGFMIAVLAISGLTGCGKGKDSGSIIDQATSGSKDCVFKTQKLDLGDQAAKDYNRIQLVGERVYATTYANAGKMAIISFNQDGSDVKSYKVAEADNENHSFINFDKDGNMYAILEIYNYMDDNVELYSDPDEADSYPEEGSSEASSEDGSEASSEADVDSSSDANEEADAEIRMDSEQIIVVDDAAEVDTDPEAMAMYMGDEEDHQYLVKYDPEGNELYRICLDENVDENSYFSIFSMIYSEDYGVLLSSTKGIQRFNEADSSFKMLLDTTDKSSPYADSSISLYNGFDGQLFASLWGQKGIELYPFDAATGKMGEKSSAFGTYDNYIFFGGNGYDLYVSRSDGIYGYDMSKDKLEKLIDYVFSDISVDYSLSSIVAISDQEFIANLPDGDGDYALFRLAKVPADQVKEKTTLTIAGSFIDYDIRQRAYKFNQENDEYRIKVVDYTSLTSGDDWNAGATQFNLDIVSGNTPDIMLFASEEPVDSYINKGLFVDLLPFINADPDLKDVKFVDNVFEAFKTGDRLYQLVPSYYINTVTTKKSYLKGQETLTLKDCQDLIEAKGVKISDAFGLVSQETILNYGLMTSGDKYIDWENKKCHFDDESFTELLEFAKQFPKEISDDMYNEYDDAALFKGDALFDLTYLNNFRSYARTKQGRFGDDISFIGFPNDLGINCSVINANYRFAISSQSKHPDVCWDFIRQFLMDDYQNNLLYDFPIRKDYFDKMAEDSLDNSFWLDENGYKVYEKEYSYIGDQQIELKPLTKEEAQLMKDYVQSLTMVYAPNQSVNSIIMEEATAFFNDQKSAKEVTDIIQSRLTIYVNENS